MATVKGIWVFNKTYEPPATGLTSQEVNFTSNNQEFSSMEFWYDGALIKYVPGDVFAAEDYGDYWHDEAYRTVDFGTTEQDVSDEFYTFLTENAVQQGDSLSMINGTKWQINQDFLAGPGTGKWETANTTLYFNNQVYSISRFCIGYASPGGINEDPDILETLADYITARTISGEYIAFHDGYSFRLDIGEIISGDVDVLYEWLTSNGIPYIAEPISGVWKFNETLVQSTFNVMWEDVTFKSNGIEYLSMVDDGSDLNNYIGYSLNTKDNQDSSKIVWAYTGDKWNDEAYKTVDFGETPQEVSNDFYTWFIANAVQQVADTSTKITYNGTAIASIEAGQTATLSCAGKKAKTDIIINFISAGVIIYNNTETTVETGKTATLSCAGKKMLTDIMVTITAEPELETLATPTISLDGNTLSITDESSLATGFAILVDGVEKTTVEVN